MAKDTLGGSSDVLSDAIGIELGYAEITSSATSATLFVNAADDTGDVAGLSIPVTVGTRPILLKFWCQRAYNNTATASTIVSIFEGDTIISLARIDQHATVSEGGPITVQRRLAPSAGLHTYKVNLSVIGASTATIVASTDGPAFINAIGV
jgi:hypothetical protein